jgi:hypothetical protein
MVLIEGRIDARDMALTERVIKNGVDQHQIDPDARSILGRSHAEPDAVDRL